MSTPNASNFRLSNPLEAPTTTDQHKDSNLPPPRTQIGIREDVSPPLSTVRMDTFVYSLTFLVLLAALFFSLRLSEWKINEGGLGGVNMLFGKKPVGAGAGEPIME